MNYIAIPHQFSPVRWEIESLEAAAVDDGLEIEYFKDMEEVERVFSGEIPENYRKEIEKVGFPCVHLYAEGGDISWEKAADFDVEQASLEFLLSNYNSIIEIEDEKDAKYYATEYKCHQWPEVRALAREIWRDIRREN